uniref:DNA (cytosine-5-)-methyltransferase n=1 Tax=Strigomonas oncopelti TaxID=5657 RepID=U5KM81_STROO|nr:DNA (cytosine-5-)-methyltransferase [Strigomonas oncopelti]
MATPPATTSTTEVPSYFTGCYPAGAFLVADKRSLGPLVLELRRAQLLKKSTRNVTQFDLDYTLVLPPPPPPLEDIAVEKGRQGELPSFLAQLDHHQLYISKAQTIWEAATAATAKEGREKGDEAEPGDALLCLHRDIAARLQKLRAQEEVLPFVTLPARQQPSSVALALSQWSHPTAERTHVYTAVHVAGAMTPETLARYLSGGYLASSQGAAASQPPVAFVYFLRAYSRPCYTAADLSRLPVSHQQLLLRAGTQQAPAPHPDGSFTFTELFGGIGMFRAGLEAAGGTAALAVEMAPPAVTVYDANFPPCATAGLLWAGDLTELPSYLLPRGHGLLSAGFPCQSFAKAGPALGLQMQHGQLFYEVVRALRACLPACFLLENVANLVEVEDGRQLAEILRWLRCPLTGETQTATAAAAPLYAVQYRVLDGQHVSAQVRRRVYFVGIRSDVPLREKEKDEENARERGTCAEDVLRRAEEKLEQMAAAAQSATEVLPRVTVPTSRPPSACTGRSPAHVLYRTVRDVLLSSHPWQPSASPSPSSSAPPACYACLADYLRSLHLSQVQWEALARTHSFRQHPSWRVADLRGRARTLMGSYRTSYQLYSEFVPANTEETDAAVAAVQRTLAAVGGRSDPSRDGDRCEDNKEDTATNKPDDEDASLFASPLRFYAARECARLQGIPDSFELQIPQEQPFFADAAASGRREEEKCTGDRRSLSEGSIYKLIGNAVNPIVIECIAKAMCEVVAMEKVGCS